MSDGPERPRPRWQLAALAAALPLVALVALDLGLRGLGWLPPDSPLLFFARTHAARFTPFVEGPGGELTIRPDWVNDGDTMHGRRGRRPGRQFLIPGFRPLQLARAKPAGELRVFALGGSTTYGLYAGGDAAFPARLEAGLRQRAPGRDVRVVNLGCPGFASDRVAALLDTVLTLAPDLVVVYSGHNEMLGGRVGAVSDLDPALRLRARLLEYSSLFAWLDYGLTSTLWKREARREREDVAALRAGEIPTWIPQEARGRREPGQAYRERAAARYAANLERMVAAARAAGVPLLFALPVANLLSPPGVSEHAPGFEARADFDADLRAAQALLESGEPGHALERANAAIALSPEYAEAHFLRGRALAALGRHDEALEALREAVDRDVRTHRMTRRLATAFLDAMAHTAAPYVDLRPDFEGTLDEATMKRLFVDHLHPTAEGHARIAARLLPQAEALLGLGRAQEAAHRAPPP